MIRVSSRLICPTHPRSSFTVPSSRFTRFPAGLSELSSASSSATRFYIIKGLLGTACELSDMKQRTFSRFNFSNLRILDCCVRQNVLEYKEKMLESDRIGNRVGLESR